MPPRPPGATGSGPSGALPSLPQGNKRKGLASRCQAQSSFLCEACRARSRGRRKGDTLAVGCLVPSPEGLCAEKLPPQPSPGKLSIWPQPAAGCVWVKHCVFLFLAVDSFSLSWLLFSFVASASSGSAVALFSHSSCRPQTPSPLLRASFHVFLSFPQFSRSLGANQPPVFSLAWGLPSPLLSPFFPFPPPLPSPPCSLSFQEYAISQKVPFSQPWLFSCVSRVLTSQRNV